MESALPELPKLQIKQDTSLPEGARVESSRAMIWIIDSHSEQTLIQTLASLDADPALIDAAEELAAQLDRLPDGKGPVFATTRPGIRHAVIRVSPALTGFRSLEKARKAVEGLMADHPEQIEALLLATETASNERMAEALVAALHAGIFRLPRIGKPGNDTPPVRSLALYRMTGAPDLAAAEATAEGNNIARWLTQLPGNHLTPGQYRSMAESLAVREGWESRFLDLEALKAQGAGAFLSVAQASPANDAGMLHLRYRPNGASGRPLTLVGKGICFDTGGTNLKNADGMLGMHGDMQGSAVALGTLLALTRLGFDRPVDCWLALAENHIGSKASKCNDVVTAANGTTIEIINTDAEGRMVLADTLAMASREEPAALLDYATLTGSCVAALGHRMSGAMSNRPDWVMPLIETGEQCGERIWPLPYAEDYDEDLESEVADVLQCRPPAEADHLYAARFLGRFVDPAIGWVHVDLSSGTRKGGLGHIPSDVIGYGVRFGVQWMRRLASDLTP